MTSGERGDLPANVARVLDGFLAAAREALGDDLRSAILFGSAAEGRLRPTSDVNLLLILARFDPARADRLAEPLAFAHAAVRLQAMLLLETELPAAARAFTAKFADIARRHRVLHGTDPFAALEIPRRALIHRLEQVLLNLTLRLRQAYARHGAHEEELARILADAAGPLRAAAASLLALEGQTPPAPREALRQVVARLDFAGGETLLTQISAARERGVLAPGVAKPALLQCVALLQALRARVEALE